MFISYQIMTTIVGLLHVGFLILEMFLWTGPIGRRVFRSTPEFAQASKALAMNQGLYNGFLAAGIFIGLLTNYIFLSSLFLAFVIVAGIFGGLTVSKRIFYIQAAPAIVALILARLNL